jgi:hypothetical protein
MRTVNQNLQYTWHCDAGHAWLEVSIDEIRALNITDLISEYSYVNGETVYLEEDCDAGIFLECLKAKLPRHEAVTYIAKHTTGDSPIRRYRRWQAQ